MYINATGCYVPEARVDNAHFLPLNGLTDEWISKRTGIHTRSHVGEGESQETMAIEAVRRALPSLPYSIGEVDLIVAAAYSAIDNVGTVAHLVQREWDIKGAKCVACTSACSSLINGMEIIEGYFAMGKASKALLISSEQNSYYANETDPKCGHLWGDGAVAIFLSAEPCGEGEPRVVEVHTSGLGHLGKGPEGVKLRPREGGITMPDGRDVFIHACDEMVRELEAVTAPQGLTPGELDRIITHQANARIAGQIIHRLGMDAERFPSNIGELGNTGSASAGIVFAQQRGDFAPGERVGMTVFGGGYSSGACLIEM
ncbi:MAG: ketoacyl-ACP synthase III [Candidatus Amulumruptor caecigallinarius]|nr:ketoacyl-ACP synthase III [Candidatus Amulumruptor caecigallinarius]MCM1397643.1 ketoacyl-ACP synthase III [Candidatus Amulumruptor caecigallinarius]MCM1454677.1 ketoacyl-ACP synthase III [bacterium]